MLKKYELKKLPEWMKQLRQKFLRYIFESKNSSECAGRGHSVKKKKPELFGEHRSEQTGYGLEKLVEYFVYGNHKALKLSEKPVFKHVL